MTKGKKIGHADMRGDSGIALIHRIVNKMGFVWNALHLEAGIDGLIEVRDANTEVVSNCIIQVQSKAGNSYFKSETETTFEFICKERDLDYWLGGNSPVILVVSRPSNDEAYWVSIKDYFKDPKLRKTRRIVFEKTRDRFEVESRDRIASLAIPIQSGLYLSAIPQEEVLFSNLIPLTEYPKRLFRATTRLRYPSQVWEQFEKSKQQGQPEWFLHEKYIYSFHDLTFPPWTRFCIAGTTRNLSTDDWAYSHERKKNYVFVRLLLGCLKELLFRQGIRYQKLKDHYFFRATEDLNERKVGGLSVFKAYESKQTAGRIAYFRHRAAKLKWVRFDDSWYLEVTPSYHFTRDGWKLSRFFEERLRGIKQLERQNKTHLRQVRLWEEILTQKHIISSRKKLHQKSFFEDDSDAEPAREPYELISFKDILSFTIDKNVPEKVWLSSRYDDEPEKNDIQLELFD